MKYKYLILSVILSLILGCASGKKQVTNSSPTVENDPCNGDSTTFILYMQGPLSDTALIDEDEFYLMISSDSTHRDTVLQKDFQICDGKMYYHFGNIDVNKMYKLLVGELDNRGGYPYNMFPREMSGKELLGAE